MALSVEIRKKLGNFQLDVQFEAGQETVALLGASGCGKSVTLRCIAGLLTPDEGRIVLDGTTLYDSAARINLPPQKRRVGYLFQQYALFPHMTVRQNIAAAVLDKQQREAVAAKKLRQFHLEGVAEQTPHQLSGGQQQRTALARILASSPTLLLLDEPFSALDSSLKDQLELDLAKTLEAFFGTILWVSHDRGEVFRNCRRVCVLDQGRSQGIYTPQSLLHHPATEAAARLSGCNNFTDAVPRGKSVYLPEWGLEWDCNRKVPDRVRRVGIRAQHVVPAEKDSKNAVSCTIVRVVPDAFTTIVFLHPEHAPADAVPLRMELPHEARLVLSNQRSLTIAVDPDHLLLF